MTGAAPLPVSRMAIHTMTTRPLSLRAAAQVFSEHGAAGISIWREALGDVDRSEVSRIVADAGLRIPSLVRAGFFVQERAEKRRQAIDDAIRALDDAAAIGAKSLVIVAGATPGVPLDTARAMVSDALRELAPNAASRDVRLALEPLHPMYAADRSCVNTLRQARAICEAVDHPALGVAIDVYHVWWDDALEAEITILGAQGRIFGFHVCDFLPQTEHLLLDRGIMGEGVIPIRRIRSAVETAGFDGLIEVEILSQRLWQEDQRDVLRRIVSAWDAHA